MPETTYTGNSANSQQDVVGVSTASWWGPGGWCQAPKPGHHVALDAIESASGSEWDKAFDAAYSKIYELTDATYGYEVNVNRGHGVLYVQIHGVNHLLCSFFVHECDEAAFFVELFPKILKTAVMDGNNKTLERAIIAFIRHGHGKDVVSENGVTLEQQRRLDEDWRMMERSRKATK